MWTDKYMLINEIIYYTHTHTHTHTISINKVHDIQEKFQKS